MLEQPEPLADEDNGGDESWWNQDASISELALCVVLGLAIGVFLGQSAVTFIDNNPNLMESPLSPVHEDSDGDGLPDIAEGNDSMLAEASPDRRDVFVEIDYVAGAKPSEEDLREVEAAFDDLPIENPDGTTGVDVHLVVDDELPHSNGTTFDEVKNDIRPQHYDYEGYGYHYAVITPTVINEDDPDASDSLMGMGTTGSLLAESNHRLSSTLVHELGHSLGISSNDFEGVDSREFACDGGGYPSLMNYRCNSVDHGFSDGGEFDDIGHLEDNQFTPSTSTLDWKYLGNLLS